MQDLLKDAQEVTISSAIRYFIGTEGGAPTIAACLRSYPWARAVFKDGKREQAEEQKRKVEFFALLGK
jgi:hypothetical protein